MAISEIDRVALYWPKRAIQNLRNDRQESHRRSSKTLPFAEAEILEGGCALYRYFMWLTPAAAAQGRRLKASRSRCEYCLNFPIRTFPRHQSPISINLDAFC
jgi:hypothetical protein